MLAALRGRWVARSVLPGHLGLRWIDDPVPAGWAAIPEYFGLDVQSFAVAGSIVIFIIGPRDGVGYRVLQAGWKPQERQRGADRLSPIAGSGTLTTIMSLKANYNDVNILIGIPDQPHFHLYRAQILKWIKKCSDRTEW